MKPTFNQWLCQVSEFMDAKDIAVAFDELTRLYHDGLSAPDAVQVLLTLSSQ